MKKLFILSSILFALLLGISCENDSKNSSGSGSGAFDGRTYVAEDGKSKLEFENGHFLFTFGISSSEQKMDYEYSINGDVLSVNLKSMTSGGLTMSFEEMLKIYSSDEREESKKTYNTSYKFKEEGDKFIFVDDFFTGKGVVYILQK